MRSPTLAILALAICSVSTVGSVATDADAFLLLGKSKKGEHPATRVVVVRENDRALVAIQPRYVGPGETVALLVPVPKATDGSPTTLPPAHVDRLDVLSAPRLAELWEQDPCELHIDQPDLDAPPPGEGAGSGSIPPAAPPDTTWKKTPAEGKTGAEIVASLEKAGFSAPEGTAAALDAYLGAGHGFVVATIDAAAGEGAGVFLPPLRVELDAKDLSLATRLAAIRGGHDLTAFVLSPDGRFEATGQPNLGVPTNLDVVDRMTKDTVSTFSAQLADYVFSTKPDALVTEYAWSATTCEGCAAPLEAAELAAFGTGLLPSAETGAQAEVLVEAGDVAAEPDGPADVRARLAACYAKALQAKPGVAGEVAVEVKTGAAGEVTGADAKSGDAALQACASEAFKGAKLGKNGVSGIAKLTFSPMARDYVASYVLTRLHARFDKAPDKDVTLRRGSPLEGGRELGPEPDAPAPAKAYASETTDNYQARYVIRHAWSGKVDCANPKRGVWGGPPKAGDAAPSSSGSAAPSAAASGASAPSAGAPKKAGGADAPQVATWLTSGKAPDLAPFAIELPAAPPKAPKPPTPEAPAPSPAPAPATEEATSTKDSGCGCGVPDASAPRGLAAALTAFVALALRRRRRADR